MYRLKHQQRPPQIPATVPRDPLIQALNFLPPFLAPNLLQHLANLYFRRRSNPHQQRATPNGCDDIARRIR